MIEVILRVAERAVFIVGAFLHHAFCGHDGAVPIRRAAHSDEGKGKKIK